MRFPIYLNSIPSLTFGHLYQKTKSKPPNQEYTLINSTPTQNQIINVVSPFAHKYTLPHSHRKSQFNDGCAACLFLKAQSNHKQKLQFLKRKQPIVFQQISKCRKRKSLPKVRNTDRPKYSSQNQDLKPEEDDLNILCKKLEVIPDNIKRHFQKMSGISCDNIAFMIYTVKHLQKRGKYAVKQENIAKLLQNAVFQQKVKLDFEQRAKNKIEGIKRKQNKMGIKVQKTDIVREIYSEIIQKKDDYDAQIQFNQQHIKKLVKMNAENTRQALTSLGQLVKKEYQKASKAERELICKKIDRLGKILIQNLQQGHNKDKITEVKQLMNLFGSHSKKEGKFVTFKNFDSDLHDLSSDSQEINQRSYSKFSISQRSLKNIKSLHRVRSGELNLTQTQTNRQKIHQQQSNTQKIEELDQQNNISFNMSNDSTKSLSGSHNKLAHRKRNGMGAIEIDTKYDQQEIIKSYYKLPEQNTGNAHKNKKNQVKVSFTKKQSAQLKKVNAVKDVSGFGSMKQELKMIKKLQIAKNKAEQHAKFHEQFLKKVEDKMKGTTVQKLVIQKKDGLITKKKKIRMIREICRKGQNHNDPQLYKDLLKYLDLYEQNCKILLRSGSYCKMKDNDEDNMGPSNFLNQKLVSPDLMFMDLNSKYIFGEADEAQMDYQGPSQTIINNALMEADINMLYPKKKSNLPKLQTHIFPNQLYKNKIQDDLIQIGLPESSIFEAIPLKKQPFTHKQYNKKEISNIGNVAKPSSSIQKLTNILAERRQRRHTVKQSNEADENNKIRVMLTQDSKFCPSII